MATQLAEPTNTVEPAETNDNAAPERDYEAEARTHGWRPQEEFKGDPSAWTDAKTFVERADTVMPLLKKQNRELLQKIDRLETTVKRLTRSEREAHESRIQALKAKQEEAVETGDLEGHRAVSEQIDKLQRSADGVQPSQDDVNSAWVGFLEKADWYGRADLPAATQEDMAKRLFADTTMRKMAEVEKYDRSHGPADFMAEVMRRVEERFPEQKPEPRRNVENVAGVTRQNVNRNARVGANLPVEAKRQAERFIKMIPGYRGLTPQQAYDKYAKDFDWEGYKA